LRNILSGLGKLAVVALIAAAFIVGLVLTVYLSLRSPEVRVPEVVNKAYLDGEAELSRAGLDIRERAKRFKPGVQPGVILDQSPRAGEVIKEGQTVAVVVSRAPKEGEEALAAEAEEARRAEEVPVVANRNANASAGDGNREANQNRERRRPSNRNANAANSNANSNRGGNLNSSANTNNRNPGRNENRNTARPANSNRVTPPRNTNAARPGGTGAERRPAP